MMTVFARSYPEFSSSSTVWTSLYDRHDRPDRV